MTELQLKHTSHTGRKRVPFEQLYSLAYNGESERVYNIYRKLPPDDKLNCTNKFVYLEAVRGCAARLKSISLLHNDILAEQESAVLKDIIKSFEAYCSDTGLYPREYYTAVITAADQFTVQGDNSTAIGYLNSLLDSDINKFPDLNIAVCNRITDLFIAVNKPEKAHSLLGKLLRRTYLIPDKNIIAEMLFKLCLTSLREGYFSQYKNMLFLGLHFFYTNIPLREKFFNQLRITYRRSRNILIHHNEVSYFNKFIFMLHWIYFSTPGLNSTRTGLLHRTASKTLLGLIYILNYASGNNTINAFSKLESLLSDSGGIAKRQEGTKNILITRAMGGIGDLLMMTPAIQALKLKHPEYIIDMAVPKRYFPLFKGNTDINVIDIESEILSPSSYDKWFNLTDCPASRVESRTSPDVKMDRIKIFSNSLGIRGNNYLRMSKLPVYKVTREEDNSAFDFLTRHGLLNKSIIGIQLHSDETYRDYPLMNELVNTVSEKYKVIIFDNEQISGYYPPDIIKAEGLPLRTAFSIASKCSAIIAPDSSFIHLAAALDIPAIALFGPIDGKVRTRHYPKCVYVSSEDILGCIPCWRNEAIPCKLTGKRDSICMTAIPVNRIMNELEKMVPCANQSLIKN